MSGTFFALWQLYKMLRRSTTALKRMFSTVSFPPPRGAMWVRRLSTHYDGLGRKAWEFEQTTIDDAADIPTDKIKWFDYDVAGRLMTVTLPVVDDPEDDPDMDETVTPVYDYYYDDYGNMAGIHDPKGRLMVFEYDELGRQTHKYMPFVWTGTIDHIQEFYGQITIPTGQLYEYTGYDDFGRVTLQLDYKEQATGYFYNSRGRLEYKVYYDADADTTDGVNAYYAADVAAFGNDVESYTQLTEKTHYTYDTLGRQDTVTDSTGTTTYYYDVEGRIESVVSPQGTVSYEYNSITGQKTQTYSSNMDTGYGYDGLGRLQEVSTTSETTYYGYDEVGNRQWQCIDTTGDFVYEQQTGSEIRIGYTYNALNRLTDLIQQKTGPAQLASYHYDLAADGMRQGLDETILQSAGTETRNIDYTYDNLNRLMDETADTDPSGNGYDTDYTYDLAGNRTKRVITVNFQPFTTEYVYYPDTDKLHTETHCGASCAMIIGDEKYYAYAGTGINGYTYRDSQGNRVSPLKVFFYGLPNKWNSILFYTLMILIPILFFAPVFVRQWNRIKGSIDPLASPDLKLWHRMLCILLAYIFLVGPEAFHMLARAESQYANLGTSTWGQVDRTITYTYDANGSVETKTTTVTSTSAVVETVTNEYNLAGRLDKVITDNGTTEHVVEYRYNPQGIRIQSYSYDRPSGGGTKSAETTTVYLVDSYNHTGYAQVLEEQIYNGVDISGAADYLTTYTIGDDVIAQNVDGVVQYLLYDGHGSTRQLAEYDTAVTGEVSVYDTYSYDGYGVMLQNESVAQNDPGKTAQQATNLLYAGEMFDADSQQYYNRARYYNPLSGLFNRVDPYSGNMQDPQSLHKYAFVHNNPVNNIDPTGMFSIGGFALGTLNVAGIVMTAVSLGFKAYRIGMGFKHLNVLSDVMLKLSRTPLDPITLLQIRNHLFLLAVAIIGDIASTALSMVQDILYEFAFAIAATAVIAAASGLIKGSDRGIKIGITKYMNVRKMAQVRKLGIKQHFFCKFFFLLN